jgi:hypothetical protein
MSTADATSAKAPLRKVAEIELCGERFDLARNGRFELVRNLPPDAYGRAVAVAVEAGDLLSREPSAAGARYIDALVQLTGELLVKLQGQRDLQQAASDPRQEG